MVPLIRSRPLLSFFVLACGLSWLGWLNYILSRSGLGVIDVDYPVVLGSTQPLGVIPGAFLGPIGSALIVTAVVDGRAGLRAWAGRLFRWRADWRWYAVSRLAVPAGLVAVGTVASLVIGGSVVAPAPTLLALYAPVLVLQLVTTGLAEEPGWRDFGLSRLQRRHSPLVSAAILGPVWALWHYPLFLTDWAEGPGRSWTGLLAFTVFCLGFNIVMSWMFNRTGESLPLSMLMHVSANTFASVLWSAMFPAIAAQHVYPLLALAAVVAAVAVVVGTRGRLGRREADPSPTARATVPARQGLPSGS